MTSLVSDYLDDLAVDVADGLGRRALDEGEEQTLAQLLLHLHLQVSVHKQLESFIVDILQDKDKCNSMLLQYLNIFTTIIRHS